MVDGYRMRPATQDDATYLAEARRKMFVEMGKPNNETMQAVVDTFVSWVREKMAQGLFLGWVIETESAAAASGGILLIDWPPNRADLGPYRAYLLNVYTQPGHRRRGLARWLVEAALAEARRRNIRVMALHASDEGKSLYEKLGFRTTREMMRVEEER